MSTTDVSKRFPRALRIGLVSTPIHLDLLAEGAKAAQVFDKIASGPACADLYAGQNAQLREEMAALRVKSAVALGIVADLIKAAHVGRLATDADDLVRRARECLIYE